MSARAKGTWIEPFLKGDEDASKELIERLERPLMNFIARFINDEHAAEDIFQETFVRFIRSIDEFKPNVAASTWLYTIAKNLCLDYLKTKKRHLSLEQDQNNIVSFKDMIKSKGLEPREKLELDEQIEKVKKALAELPLKKKEALILRLFSDLSYDEISRISNSPTGTCKYRVHEAIKDLDKKIGGQFQEAQYGL